jgi:long-chain acyl-CoA synthetase
MIADENGNEVPVGTTGELLAKGPQVMEGYWHKPEETAMVFHNDWFKTGDLGLSTRMDSSQLLTGKRI